MNQIYQVVGISTYVLQDTGGIWDIRETGLRDIEGILEEAGTLLELWREETIDRSELHAHPSDPIRRFATVGITPQHDYTTYRNAHTIYSRQQ